MTTVGNVRQMDSGMLLSKYEAGEHEAVWHHIRSLDNLNEEQRTEVVAVAEATMRRVARNVDLLSDRLAKRGWLALFSEHSALRTMPAHSDRSVFIQIEEECGAPLPPTLFAFWKCVGGVNWVWDYRINSSAPNLNVDLPMDEMDPLCIDPPSVATSFLDEWKEQKNDPDRETDDPFPIELAPDYLHKANISGGMPYAISIPFWGADPVFANERHELPFVDYLRLVFKWAGFPGLEDHKERQDVKQFIRTFGEGLIAF